MSVASVLEKLNALTDEAAALAPVLSALGVPGVTSVGAILGGVQAIASHVGEAMNTHSELESATDKAELDALLARLIDEADALNKLAHEG